LLWLNGWMDKDATCYGVRPRPRRLCIRWASGLLSTSPNRWRSPPPQFLVHVHCGQTVVSIKTVLGTEVGLAPGHIVLDGDPAPSPKKGTEPPPQFSTHFYCGQTVAYIKMSLGMAVGLSPGDFVLYGDPAPLQKRGAAPNFRPMSIAAKRLDVPRCHLVRR